MKHFKLTDKTKVNIFGTTLFQIELTTDCMWGKKGDKGGYIEKESNIYGDAWVYDDAQVYGNASVSGNAKVSGNAQVFGNAWVSGNARVFGNAQVCGNARVFGEAWVYGEASVYGNARVFGNVWEFSPFQLQGSRDFLNESKKGYLKVGCHEYTLGYWKDNFKRIGKIENYSEKQIDEYGLYIDLVIKLNELR